MEDKVSVIIKYKDTVTKSVLESVTMLDAEIKRVHHSINAVTASVPKSKIGKIKLDPNVEYVELDQEAHILGFPDDSLPLEKNIQRIYTTAQTIPWGISKIRATEVWPEGNKGTGIKVCIIDTGIDYTHEDLKDNYKGGYNFINNTNDPKDDHGHGTHVAGTVAAMDNNIGVIGIAPEAHIYSLKVLDSNGSGSYSNIISAIDWTINNNMQVISMSFGGSGFSQALKDICDKAYNSGIILVAAAGNSDGDGSQDTVSYPAKFDSVIAVAATDSNDARASFSSCGPEVELAAPGVNVLSTVPKGTCKLCDSSGYKQLNGTSMSTPHVSGTAALVLKAHPEMTNADVRKTMQDTTVDLGQQGRDIFFGYGRIDAKAAVDHGPTPQKKYRCTGTPDYQCVEDPNGPYNSLAECQAACKAPVTKYRCTGSPNYQCVEDPNGPYNSLAECQAACKAPVTKYRCTGSPNYQCVEDPNGPYNSLAECQAVCKAPVTKYRCTGSPNYQCVEDPNGPYNSLAECQAACKPQVKKFRVHIIGSQDRVTGVMAIKSSIGEYTAEEACQQVCKIIKEIDT